MSEYTVGCNRADCFQNFCGTRCKILVSKLKGHRECPFYKTQEQNEADQKAAHKRLVELGRDDLIKKYEHNPQRRGLW